MIANAPTPASLHPRSIRRRFKRGIAWGAAALMCAGGSGCAELSALDISLPDFAGGALNESTVAAGLRQALQVGSERASSLLARDGGFARNPVLRLSLPDELHNVAKTLRAVGFGSQVDALELSMNRAAESAVGEAVPIFTNAIQSMTIADAFSILNGPDDAATEYFRVRTSEALRARFTPIAQQGMREVGLYRTYEEIKTLYERIPLTTMPAPDLERHVTDRALAGLFTELAKEEAKIRADPAARTTALLRRVFGSVGAENPG